jgi:hypothetical protein
MSKRNRGEVFVQEFVIGLGFLSGLWIYAGVDPTAEIVKALSTIVPEMSGLLWLLVGVDTIISIVGAYYAGRWFGLLAVVLAFMGGLLIGSVGILLLLGGIILGRYAPQLKAHQYR